MKKRRLDDSGDEQDHTFGESKCVAPLPSSRNVRAEVWEEWVAQGLGIPGTADLHSKDFCSTRSVWLNEPLGDLLTSRNVVMGGVTQQVEGLDGYRSCPLAGGLVQGC